MNVSRRFAGVGIAACAVALLVGGLCWLRLRSSSQDPHQAQYRLGLADEDELVRFRDGAFLEPISLAEHRAAFADWLSNSPFSSTPASHYRHARASGEIVRVVDGMIDGKLVSAVVLWESGGGSGVFYSLHLLARDDNGKLRDMADFGLGDRSQILDVKIVDDTIEVELVRAGWNDPACCPTEHVRLSVRWDGADTLKETRAEVGASRPGSTTP